MANNSLTFTDKLPELSSLGEEVLVIYDQNLIKKIKGFSGWLKSADASYSVKAGESLKDVQKFPQHILRLTKTLEGLSSRRLTVVVVGGGSVGDFGGFVASIMKRGLRLIHIPSTWLAAIDSSHGGKTGLNVGGAKNQIGTFYPADRVILVRDLLLGQPESRAFEGFAELLKIALLTGGSLWRSVAAEHQVNGPVLWRHLKSAIEGKLKFVSRDPEEKSGLRHVLNLGHTVGHVFESAFQLPHGIAINYGLRFALNWSAHSGVMARRDYSRLMLEPVMAYLLSAHRDELLTMSRSDEARFRKLLLSDKKKTKAATVRFVFLKKPGAFSIQEVTVDQIISEMKRQAQDEDESYD